MRKTSQDGTDSTSVTSGLENELKKPGVNTNKIKKSSIKRKVPNFSHDSDDAIIEPLLQTEKENSVNINNSAKYVLNKPKTDCLYERDPKALESPKVTTPVSIANNVTSNNVSENQSSPSIISDTAPIYNHMNVNVFSGNELKNLAISIGHPILIEIDGCKTVGIGPNPLIFTTAKIHTDSKKKLMEPFQVTPMPILSTVEGNVVKAGVIYEDDKKYSVLHNNKHDVSKNVGNKSEFKLDHANFNDLTRVKVLPNETLSNCIQTNNPQNIKKELDAQDPFDKSAKLFSKDQKVSLKTINTNSIDSKSPIPIVTSDDTVKTITNPIATATCKANGVINSDTSKQPIGTDAKSITADKPKGVSSNEKINSDKNLQPCASSSKPNNKSNINTTNDKIDNTKSFSTSSKKLQRQKNAAVEETKEINYTEFNNITTGKNSAILDKAVSTPLDLKSDNTTTYKMSTPMTTIATKGNAPILTSGIPSKTFNSSLSKSSVITGTSAPINSKPVIETVKTKPAPTRIPEPSIKSTTKSPVIVTSTTSSSKTSTTSTAKSTKLVDDSSSSKHDITSAKINNTQPTTTSSVASTLPLYIVSTSKTKIGSPSTPSISTVTKKSLDQKPITELVNTNGKSGKLLMSTTLSQSNQSSSKPKNTSASMLVQKEDDRA